MCEVLIDQQDVYLAISVDRSHPDIRRFVRLDVNNSAFLLGPQNARRLANVLLKYADLIERPAAEATCNLVAELDLEAAAARSQRRAIRRRPWLRVPD